MLKLDIWNIVWTIVNILVLYAIFRKFLFQPVLKVIQDRENIIKNQIDKPIRLLLKLDSVLKKKEPRLLKQQSRKLRI